MPQRGGNPARIGESAAVNSGETVELSLERGLRLLPGRSAKR